MAGFGGLVGGIGGAVGGLFAAEGYGAQADGYFAAAMSYRKAARMTLDNIDIEKSSAEMKNFQINRQVAKVGGTMVAAEGAANISGGSAGDLMRESVHEGAIASAMVNIQSGMNINQFKIQAEAYEGMAASATAAGHAAESAASGAMWCGAFSLLGGIIGMF